MRKTFILSIILILSFKVQGQINAKDSTVQVIGYWDLNEKQEFQASYEKYKIKDLDTTFVIKSTYDIDITVKDSATNSYEIEWFYKNYNIESESKLVERLSKIAENMSVIIKTDEFGAFIEVKNWEEIKNYIDEVTTVMKGELKDIPNIDKIIEQVSMIYSTKEGIEANAIKDIQQFYSFHGAMYKLNEKLSGNLETRNSYGGKPFDTKIEVSLDEIDFENDNCVLRTFQVVDSEQLTNATFDYLSKMAEIGGQKIKKEDIPPLTNETWVASRIHGSTGWTTYSILTKEVSAENSTNIEETIIELK